MHDGPGFFTGKSGDFSKETFSFILVSGVTKGFTCYLLMIYLQILPLFTKDVRSNHDRTIRCTSCCANVSEREGFTLWPHSEEEE